MSPLAVAKAYAAAAQQARPQPPAAGEGLDFAQLVNQAMGDTVSASKQAERAMQMHSQGRAELVDVVTSVASAQASLETVMAVRDQVISAYQEIMRMPI